MFTAIEQVHALPEIAHYWSNKHLIPILQQVGHSSSIEMFRNYIAQLSRERPREICRVLSVGCGDSASEINIGQWLIENKIENFTFECMDINSEVLERGKRSVASTGYADKFSFTVFDINAWRPIGKYQIILAIQSLHHFLELEMLFDKIHSALDPDGLFLTDDMIGRNGHQRWPEALTSVNALWKELPREYTYNHSLKRYEATYENWDCSVDSFEGIRAQDILPLLVKKFHFDLFVGFGNVIDIFVDRAFGPNFDPERAWDRNFIDRVHALDMQQMEQGIVKPTHIQAAMRNRPVENPRFYKHLTPEFCIRKADPVRFGKLLAFVSSIVARRS